MADQHNRPGQNGRPAPEAGNVRGGSGVRRNRPAGERSMRIGKPAGGERPLGDAKHAQDGRNANGGRPFRNERPAKAGGQLRGERPMLGERPGKNDRAKPAKPTITARDAALRALGEVVARGAYASQAIDRQLTENSISPEDRSTSRIPRPGRPW